MPEKRAMTVNPDNTSSRLSPVGSLPFATLGNTDAEIDYPLQGPISDQYFLLETIWLDVKRSEDGLTIVSSARFGFYGVGGSLEEAVEDAMAMLVAHYEDLLDAEKEEELPPFYLSRLEKLRSILIAS